MNFLSVFDCFVGLALKRLKKYQTQWRIQNPLKQLKGSFLRNIVDTQCRFNIDTTLYIVVSTLKQCRVSTGK